MRAFVLAASGRTRCLARSEALRLRERGVDALFVDSLEGAPEDMARFRCFNPFFVDAATPLRVPGQPAHALSVEAIWQGLKVVEGKTAFEMFEQKPWKRPADAKRKVLPHYRYAESVFMYGNEVVDLVTARHCIYLPSYFQLLMERVPREIHLEIEHALSSGRDVVFYDWDHNFDINDASSSFSHSAILASWYRGTWHRDYVRPAAGLFRARWPERRLPTWLELELRRER